MLHLGYLLDDHLLSTRRHAAHAPTGLDERYYQGGGGGGGNGGDGGGGGGGRRARGEGRIVIDVVIT